MNKLFIVLLAVCLFSVISAHAFVKRDTPTEDDLKAKLNDMNAQVTKLREAIDQQIAAVVNSDVLKKNLNDAIDVATKEFENLKSKLAAASGATPAA